MLKLFINDTDATAGSIPVSWCVDDVTLMKLKEDGINQPKIVIVITPKDNTEQSYDVKVPLKDLMTYIPLNFKGENMIMAFIDDEDDKHFDKRISYAYYDSGGGIMLTGRYYNAVNVKELETATHEPLIINVPDKCFAKEPPVWEKKWVNAMFRSKPADQCDYRRRRLWAYSVQPIIALIIEGAILIPTLISFLLALRGFSLKYFAHPFLYDSEDVVGGLFGGGSVFIGKSESNFKKYITVPLMPIISIPAMLIPSLIYLGILPLASVISTAITIVSIIVSIVIFALIFGYILYVYDKKKNLSIYDDDDALLAVTCDGSNKPMSISNLPKKQQTINLKFKALKTKVCRPYSR